MFLTTHAAVGILISRHVHNPWAVFGLSFASHFVLDFIPHGDETLYHDQEWQEHHRYKWPIIVNTIDLIGLFSLIFWAIGHPAAATSQLMLIGIIGSILPDFLSFLFPVIHERFSWLFVVRWLYKLTKPTGLRYLVRAQNWIHEVLHHDLIRQDMDCLAGIAMQIVVIGTCMYFRR